MVVVKYNHNYGYMFIATARPYKKSYMNNLESLMLALLGLLLLLMLAYQHSKEQLLLPYVMITHQHSTVCTDTLHIILSTEGKKTSEVHYSENYKPEKKRKRTEH